MREKNVSQTFCQKLGAREGGYDHERETQSISNLCVLVYDLDIRH